MKIFDGQKGKRVNEAEYATFTHKRCAACDRVRAVSMFYRKRTQTARGWAWDTFCIECRRSACKEYGATHKAARNARLRRWRKANPSLAKAKDRRAHLKAKYGLSPEQVESMRKAQGGKCAICDRKQARLLVDHCHTSGKVRGLLCQTCNTFLGWYEGKAEHILRFQKYLLGR